MWIKAKQQHKATSAGNRNFLRIFSLLILVVLLFPVGLVSVGAEETLRLIPGGITFGARLSFPGVTVTGFSEDGVGPAQSAGLQKGDRVLELNGRQISSCEEFATLIENANGKELSIKVLRQGREMNFSVTPLLTDGRYRIGVTVRDGAAGVGTVTFFTENGAFGGLGHGVYCKDTGELAPFCAGSVCGVVIKGIRRGLAGSPGEIMGALTPERLGTLSANTPVGVFGLYGRIPDALKMGAVEVAGPEELTRGAATILSTLGEDGIGEYEIEITSISEPRGAGEKSFAIRVTDKRLLERTGGIVQGMSGSPILQNGKLVGAVTHVMIGDPTAGYGIFIRNMLSEMPELLQ